MVNIHLETFIRAPVGLCFDLALTVETHQASMGEQHHGRAVAGVTSGRLKMGDTVTWEAVHFGVRQRLTSKIVMVTEPRAGADGKAEIGGFIDVMQRGAFKFWVHHHSFVAAPEGTRMTDNIQFASPFGPVGRAFDALVLEGYMRRFLVDHNERFKRIAEEEARRGAGRDSEDLRGVTR